MPKKIQEGVTARKLARKFGLVGAVSPQLDETIVPVVVLDDLKDVDEWKDAWASGSFGAAGVGNVNVWSLRNPAGSGKVLELYELGVSSTTTQRFVIVATVVDLALAGAISGAYQDLDGLFVDNLSPAGQMRNGVELVGAIVGFRILTFRIVANIQETQRVRVAIRPAQFINFWQQTADLDVALNLQWRERNLRPDGT